MKIIVTGACGYLGSRLVNMLIYTGMEVVGVDSCIYDETTFTTFGDHPRFSTIRDDFRNVTMEETFTKDADAIIHLAGISNDPTADILDPNFVYDTNTVGTEQLAHRAAMAGVKRFVFASSASVYDGCGVDNADEATRVMPIGSYSHSKLLAEVRLQELSNRLGGQRLEPVILRQGTVYGTSPRMRYDLVVNTMVRAAATKGEITVHLPGTQMRPHLDISECVATQAWAAMMRWPTHPNVTSVMYNVVTKNLPIHELADIIADVGNKNNSPYGSEVPVVVHEAPAPPTRMRDYNISHDAIYMKRGALPMPMHHSIRDVYVAVNRTQNPYDDKYENLKVLLKKG